MVDQVDGILAAYLPGDGQRFFLPDPVVEIETPIALVPAHLPNPLGDGIVKEMHVLPLGQCREGGFNPVAELPFRDDEQFTGLGQPDAPVPPQARFASVVGRDSIGTDENLTHGTIYTRKMKDNEERKRSKETTASIMRQPWAVEVHRSGRAGR